MPALIPSVVREDNGAGGREPSADAMADRDLCALDLRRRDASHLPYALLQGVHAVHPRMHVGEAAAVGVHRQFASGGGVTLAYEVLRLAAPHEAEVFEPVERNVGEGVVHHQMIDVGVAYASLLECLAAR